MYCNIDNALHKNSQHPVKDKRYSKDLVVNHLEGHREITTKTGLVRSLKYYYKDSVNFVDANY